MKVFVPSLLLLLLLLLLGVASPVPLLTRPVAKEVEADALCPEGWQEDLERSRCLVEIPRPAGLRPSVIRQLVHFCSQYPEGMLSFTQDGIACVRDLKSARQVSPSQDELNERVMKRVFGNMGLGL